MADKSMSHAERIIKVILTIISLLFAFFLIMFGSILLRDMGSWGTKPELEDYLERSNISDMKAAVEAAEKEAIKTCEKGGRNAPCIVSAWVRNGCIAVAQGNEGKQSRVFSGTTKPGRAEVEALRKCQAAGVPQCKIVVSEACSLPRY